MKILLYIFLLFILPLNRNYAQEMPNYTVELDAEMHYKIKASNWQERGIKEFREDVKKLFDQVDIQYRNQGFDVLSEIIFNEKGQPSLGMFDTNIRLKTPSLHEKLEKSFSKLAKNFKPASYQGKPIVKKYLVGFKINFNNDLVSIYQDKFEPTVTFDTQLENCFTFYNVTNLPSDPIFLYTNIMPEYRGGMINLTFNLNRLLQYDSSIKSKSIKRDSLELPFIIHKDGKLGMMEKFIPNSSLGSVIIDILKKTACEWKPGIHEGRHLITSIRLKFIYDYILEDKNTQSMKLVKINAIKNMRGNEFDIKF